MVGTIPAFLGAFTGLKVLYDALASFTSSLPFSIAWLQSIQWNNADALRTGQSHAIVRFIPYPSEAEGTWSVSDRSPRRLSHSGSAHSETSIPCSQSPFRFFLTRSQEIR